VSSVLLGAGLFLVVAISFFLHGYNLVNLWQTDRLSFSSMYFNRGNFYFGGEGPYNIEKAEANFRWALRWGNPHNDPIHYQLGRIAFIRGNLQEAINQFDQQLTADPDFPKTYYMRGLTYGYLHDTERAAADFKTYIERVPESWAAHNDLVWVYFRAGEFFLAEEYARKGLDIAPQNAWLSNALGGILVSQERYEEAEPYLRTAEEQFLAMGKEGWGRAYPGNDPQVYEEGFAGTLASVEHNLKKITEAEATVHNRLSPPTAVVQ
jgi:tetratricopeptide (TPR) repeat protein